MTRHDQEPKKIIHFDPRSLRQRLADRFNSPQPKHLVTGLIPDKILIFNPPLTGENASPINPPIPLRPGFNSA